MQFIKRCRENEGQTEREEEKKAKIKKEINKH
jgi:hypothetical protein